MNIFVINNINVFFIVKKNSIYSIYCYILKNCRDTKYIILLYEKVISITHYKTKNISDHESQDPQYPVVLPNLFPGPFYLSQTLKSNINL